MKLLSWKVQEKPIFRLKLTCFDIQGHICVKYFVKNTSNVALNFKMCEICTVEMFHTKGWVKIIFIPKYHRSKKIKILHSMLQTAIYILSSSIDCWCVYLWLCWWVFCVFHFGGVVKDLSALRDKGPGFKTRSRPLTFPKAVIDFSEPYTLWGSHCTNECVSL